MMRFVGVNIILIISLIILKPSCVSKSKDKVSNESFGLDPCILFEFKKPLVDTLEFYISTLDTACQIFVRIDWDISQRIYRLNVCTPNDSRFIKNSFHFCTYIDNHKIFVNTGMEKFISGNKFKPDKIVINEYCDNNYFVIYDSVGIISTVKNLNDFDVDLSPHKLPAFRQIK